MEHVTVKDLIEGTGGSFLYGDSQMPVRHIVLDSREIGPGDLFVPLKGEKVDSHRFLEDVVKRGAACVLTSEHETLPEYAASYPCAWIRVEDTKAALQAFGRYMRKRLSLPLVGITGSVGKTTTRELIAAALSAKYRVYKTPGNKNSQVGVPITISEISKDDQVGVIELGMSEPGELKVISEIACIDMAVITNIAEDHLNRHYNMENYIFLKSKLLRNMRESEYAVLNYDDPVVRGFAKDVRCPVRWFSVKERAEGAYLYEGGLYYENEKITDASALSMKGEHNVKNALACICACKLLGVDSKTIADALSKMRGVRHRIEFVAEVDGVTYIDDSKGTNVDATITAVNSMQADTVLLLGGKDKGYDYDKLFSALKNSRAVHAVLYGENRFKLLNGAVRNNYSEVTLCADFTLAVKIAAMTARAGQCVLLSPASSSFDSFSRRGGASVAESAID